MTATYQLPLFSQTTNSYLYSGFSHEGVCSEKERIALEQRYSSIFVSDNRFNRQLVSFQANKDAMLHSWIKYREGFSAQLVRTLLSEFKGQPGHTVLDPFAGSATTLLVAKMSGIDADGIELLPNCHLAWEAKSRYLSYQVDELEKIANMVEAVTPVDTGIPFPHLAITESAFSPKVEQDIMFFTKFFEDLDIGTDTKVLLRLLITSILEEVSFTRKDGQYLRWDYRAEKVQNRNQIREEQSQKPIKKIDKGELPEVKVALLRAIYGIISDIRILQMGSISTESRQRLFKGTTLEILPSLPENTYDAVITSPPYANRYDYTRTYALELAYLNVGNQIFTLRQKLLSCTVESRSKIEQLTQFYADMGVQERLNQFLSVVNQEPVFEEVNRALETRWKRGDMNNRGVLPMIHQYLVELTIVFGELYRICRSGAHVAFVNDNVRYGGEIIPIDTMTTVLAEKLGFHPVKIYVLSQKKGNSSQQMSKFGREEMRKSITVWQKP